MKQLHLTLLALAALSTVQAGAEPLPGKIGNITLSLTMTTEVGGFNGNAFKVVTDKPGDFKRLFKTVAKKLKYGNKEFIADVIERYSLPGAPADYLIRRVRFPNGFSGDFLANKAGTVIRYLGGDSSSNSSTPISTYYTTSAYHDSTVYTENSTFAAQTKNGMVTEKDTGSFKFEAPGTYLYFNPTGESYFECFCLVKGGGSYGFTDTYPEEDMEPATTSSGFMKYSATSYTGIIGTDYEGTILSGSMTVAALADAADLSAYYQAYLDYLDSLDEN